MNDERISFKRDGDRYLVYVGKERVGFVANRQERWHWRATWCSLAINGPEMKRRVRASKLIATRQNVKLEVHLQ